MPGATCVANQISPYAKIDIFFPGTRQWRSRLERSRDQMLNSLLSLPAEAGEVLSEFRSDPIFPIATNEHECLLHTLLTLTAHYSTQRFVVRNLRQYD